MTCGTKTYATCVYYEEVIPEFSDIATEECITIEETTKDIYENLEKIYKEIDLSELVNSCLSYVETGQVAKVKDILLKYEQEICTLKTKVLALENTAICDMKVTGCGLDLTGLIDVCDNPIITFSDLMNYFLTNINP